MWKRLQQFARTHWLLVSILAVSTGVRLWGLSYGLPAQYAEDEEFFIHPALRVAEHLNSVSGWDPHWYGAPAAPLITLLGIVFRVISTCFNIIHHTHAPVLLNFNHHVTLFVTVGRLIPVTASVLTVLCAYMIGALYNKKYGFIAAASIGSSFYLIQYAHIIRPDTLQACFILWSMYFLIRACEPLHVLRYYVLSALFFALACTTKFPSAFIAPVYIVVAAMQIIRAKTWKPWLVFAGVGVLALFVSAPFVFLHFSQTLHDLGFESTTQHAENMGLSWWGNMNWYLFSVFPWEVGTGIYALAVGTACYALRKRDARMSILFAACVSYLVGMSTHELHWERWAIPMTVLLLMLCAYGISFLHGHMRRSWYVLLCIIVCLAPAVRTIRTLIAYAHPEPIALATQFIEQHVDASIVREPYTPRVNAMTVPNATYHSLSWYQDHEIDYIMLGAVYERIERLAHLTNPDHAFVRAAESYAKLFSHSQVVFERPAYRHNCLYAPDWTVLFSSCATPYFGEGVYILQVKQ